MKSFESLDLAKFNTLEKSQMGKVFGGDCLTDGGTLSLGGGTASVSYSSDTKGDSGTTYHTQASTDDKAKKDLQLC